MIRTARVALCLAAPAQADLAAQPELPQEQVQASLAPVLAEPGRTVDFVRGWNVQWDGTGAPEVLAQVAYSFPGGGNMVDTRWVILALQGGVITPVATLDLPDFVDTVYDRPGLVAMTLLIYGPDDARCCPSQRVQHWVAKP